MNKEVCSTLNSGGTSKILVGQNNGPQFSCDCFVKPNYSRLHHGGRFLMDQLSSKKRYALYACSILEIIRSCVFMH